jgi:phosphoglycerol transferase MdoB-like AlkP superfamily enzyme
MMDRVEPEDDAFRNGWGHEDAIFYKRFFEYLDDEKEAQSSGKPFFVSLATIYSHMHFSVPEHRRGVYKKHKNKHQKYINSIHLSDKGLEVFMDELRSRDWLKNSIVIITGDHGSPVGDHGLHHNEAGFYDASFRVPFLMIWDGVIEPQEIKNNAYSQLDIYPTLVDMLKLTIDEHHIQGTSVFKENKKPIFLVQPYAGQYLESVRWPVKYIAHKASQKEFVFNLEEDPKEEINLIESVDEKVLAQFYADIVKLKQTNATVRENALLDTLD